MDTPSDRRYLESHEWHKLEADGSVTLGITQFAADELTDITFVSLPKIGEKIEANGRFGEVESVKATSDLYSGVGGTVTAVNDSLSNDPGAINRDPYGAGWIVKIKPNDAGELGKLLSVEEYLKKTGH